MLVSCDRKLVSCDRKLVSCDRKLVSCDRKLVSCDRQLVSSTRTALKTISSLSSMFSLCSAIINAFSTSSSLQVPFPSPVTFYFLFFLFACELFWRGLPIATSCWITWNTSRWSWAAMQLAFMNLWAVKISTISWWTAVNGHTCTFVLYQSGVWWPHLEG